MHNTAPIIKETRLPKEAGMSCNGKVNSNNLNRQRSSKINSRK